LQNLDQIVYASWYLSIKVAFNLNQGALKAHPFHGFTSKVILNCCPFTSTAISPTGSVPAIKVPAPKNSAPPLSTKAWITMFLSFNISLAVIVVVQYQKRELTTPGYIQVHTGNALASTYICDTP
jgi:hypothetical protein